MVARFVRPRIEGWKSYLADPAPANALIKKDNPNMSDEQLAYAVAKLKEIQARHRRRRGEDGHRRR